MYERDGGFRQHVSGTTCQTSCFTSISPQPGARPTPSPDCTYKSQHFPHCAPPSLPPPPPSWDTPGWKNSYIVCDCSRWLPLEARCLSSYGFPSNDTIYMYVWTLMLCWMYMYHKAVMWLPCVNSYVCTQLLGCLLIAGDNNTNVAIGLGVPLSVVVLLTLLIFCVAFYYYWKKSKYRVLRVCLQCVYNVCVSHGES